jgi:tetratricopeptide (TPR) repeat protein
MAHLTRSQYPQAITAFTEAIALNPEEAANAYTGRALAYRFLGDDAAALRDRQAADALGGPERSEWDRLVKRAYRRWQADLSDVAWQRDDPLTRDAFLLHQWTWQIYNGGLPQWVANGFGDWAEDLARAADRIGTDSTRIVAEIVRDVARILARHSGARESMFQMIATQSDQTAEEDELFGELSECEERYHRFGACHTESSFATDVEKWLDKQVREAK